MARKNEFNYFDKFVKLSEYCCSSAKLLDEIIHNYKVVELNAKMKEMHDIEHAADIEGHEIMRKLSTEFITPIEREDIVALIHKIDDVTDSIEDVLLHAYMYNIKTVRNEALEFSKIIVKSCEGLRKTLAEFSSFRKSKEIHNCIVQINKLEEEGDAIYIEAIRRLHMMSKDPIEIMSWTEGFNRLEKCCDACEEAANLVESIIMKNS
ncbi:MAG: DUF47 family protein [Tissierellia bacterium]|nr:DUF47 family protein [Tissierellia bacterium]